MGRPGAAWQCAFRVRGWRIRRVREGEGWAVLVCEREGGTLTESGESMWRPSSLDMRVRLL